MNREKVIENLNIAKNILNFPQMLSPEMRIKIGQAISAVIALLREQEPVEPYMDYDGHDVWRCENCGATIFHIEHSQADEDWKSYAKFCRQCGKKVKWE